MMKKISSIVLAVMMVCVFSFGEAGLVFAAQTDTGNGLTLKTGIIAGEAKDTKKECMPNAALVMFKVTKNKVTKSQAKKALRKGKNSVSDITVKDLWTFTPKAELITSSSGKRKYVRTNSNDTQYVRVALVKSASLSTDELVKKLSKRSDVKYAEPNYKVKAQSVTNDEYSDYQWSMQGSEEHPGTVTPNVWKQWKKATGSDNIVAVVDTGVDYTHPDLKDRMWENTHYPALKGECGFDFINGDDDPMDDNDHGTHCAGIIGATGDNGVGISGVNKRVRIMALKTLDRNGSAFSSTEVAAYNYIDKALDLGEPIKAINNSWGGGLYSYIFAELIDIVGEKGAVSVFAAGNDGVNNDENGGYPMNIDSPYKIDVAAEREDGKLASFSNYGENTVDIAAPGTGILSTVTRGYYNPSIYGTRQDEYSEEFNNYDEAEWDAMSADTLRQNVYLNGEKLTPDQVEESGIEIEKQADNGFNPKGNENPGNSLYIKAEGMQKGNLICMTVPYDLTQDTKAAPWFSFMNRSRGASDKGSIFAFVDLQQGTSLDIDTIGDMYVLGGNYLYEKRSDFWRHLSARTLQDHQLDEIKEKAAGGSDDPLKREVVFVLYAYEDGDIEIWLDDVGLSVEDKDDDYFGKYDFMNGTSMAAPYVTGAVALKAAELEAEQGGTADSETLINEIISSARIDEDMPVIQKGSLDFTKRPPQLPPRAGKITVDQPGNSLTIRGSGLGSAGTTVEIGDDDYHLEDANITSRSDKALVVENKDWINNIKTVKVSGGEGGSEKSSYRRDVYLVDGKKTINDVDYVSNTPGGKMATDGEKIYWTDEENMSICAMDPANADDGAETIATIDPDELFKIKKSKNAEYRMIFASDLAYTNGSLYALAEYGMCAACEKIEEDGQTVTVLIDESNKAIYSGEIRLIHTVQGEEGMEAESLGKLPAELEKTADITMAAYNGKLYFIGGYSYNNGSKGITKKVWIFDPKTKKWSQGPALPEGRAGGKAIQSGKNLIYTMGYSEDNAGKEIDVQKYPANLIFDGTKWKKSSVEESDCVEPYVIDGSVRRSGDDYLLSRGDISLIKDGIFFTGLPAVNYGDMFTYMTAKDNYADTGYNFIRKINEDEIRGIVVGNKLYGFKEDSMYSLPVSGGQIGVTANTPKNGSIKGTGSFMPGNTADVTVNADKDYRIKSLKVNGKAVTLNKNQTSKKLTLKDLVSDQKVTAAFEKYKFKVSVSKKGKGTVTGGKVYVKGSTATINVKAKKGWYIKSIKYSGKKVKVKKKAKKKTFKIKNIKKDMTVKVVFKKSKKK